VKLSIPLIFNTKKKTIDKGQINILKLFNRFGTQHSQHIERKFHGDSKFINTMNFPLIMASYCTINYDNSEIWIGLEM